MLRSVVNLFSTILVLALTTFFCACATLPKAKPLPDDYPILGEGTLSAIQMVRLIRKGNPPLNRKQLYQLAKIYIEEGKTEGVNWDGAWAQMILETGYLNYGGDVPRDSYNFAGIGAVGGGAPGARFESAQIGARAQIQHLKGYATELPLNGTCVDPRYKYVKKGSAPTFGQLSGKWAADPHYGAKIISLLHSFYRS